MAKVYDPIMCMMVDKPDKAQDAKKEEGFKILSAIIRGEKLVLTFEDLLNSPGKKETMEFTKKEAEAFKKDPWNTWTGNTKSIVEKFIGSKVHDATSALDKAISTCDAVEVETSRWSFSSGKSKPSGFGNWWFKIGAEEKSFSGNWSSAKAEAVKYAKEKGINRISLMT